MKTTPYFERRVLGERSYLRPEWCERVLQAPVKSEQQTDGRFRHWGFIPDSISA